MISLSHNFAEVHVQRTGGTSRHHAFQAAGCFDTIVVGDDEENFVREKGIGSWHWPSCDCCRALGKDRWDSMFTFSFARDPRETLLSTYFYRKTKLQKPNPHVIDSDISFEDWLKKVVAPLPKDSYVEFGWQSRMWTHVEKIYNFDEMEEAWVEICGRIGIDEELPDLNGTGRKSVHKYFTPELEEIVFRRFQMDRGMLSSHGIQFF